jgi:hypothetical protein
MCAVQQRVRADRGTAWAASFHGTLVMAGRSTRSLDSAMIMLWVAIAVLLITVGGGVAYVCWSVIRRRKGHAVPGGHIYITKTGLAVYGLVVVALIIGFGAAVVSPRDGLGLWIRENGHLAYAAILLAICTVAGGVLAAAGHPAVERK